MSSQTLNLVNKIVSNAEKRGVAKIALDNSTFDGKTVFYQRKAKISFGSYSYMGLEIDERLKEAAIAAIKAYGIQYPSSRIYSSLPLYTTLLKNMEKIFKTNIVLTTSLSLGHAGVIPVLIEKEDIFILDQHVHSSVQDAAEKLKAKGVKVTILRHNDIEKLSNWIEEYSKRYRRVWYAIDGIYSMYGDTAPIYDLEKLMNKYPNFYLYADDAHGISSFGENGSGWILSKIDLHKQLFLTTGMAKAFGTMGGVFITKKEEFYHKVNNCTGSLIFSGPHPIPVLGASIKSSEIHLTGEIKKRQEELHNKIAYCHKLLKRNNIPEISDKETPIFFVAISQLDAGYSLVKKMLDDGFLTNIAAFPAVSESCTGVRFTITIHHTYDEIEELIKAFKRNYTAVLSEESLSFDSIKRAFKKVHTFPTSLNFKSPVIPDSLSIHTYTSINKIPASLWNKYACREMLSWESIEALEKSMVNKDLSVESQWEFFFILVVDNRNNVILLTFFTISLTKEDMLSDINVSKTIEVIRDREPYYLTSKTMVMGTPMSEGKQMYLNGSNRVKEKAIKLLIKEVSMHADKKNVDSVLFRDFEITETFEDTIFFKQGFLQVELPDNHVIKFKGLSLSDYISSLSKRRRKYIRDRAIHNIDQYNFTLVDQPTLKEVSNFYNFYLDVVKNGMELNTYPITKESLSALLKLDSWKLLKMNFSDEFLGAMLIYETNDSVQAVFVSLNYRFLNLDIYPKLIWKTIEHAHFSDKNSVLLGYSASQNKRKFGAVIKKRYAYYKSNDNLNQLLLHTHTVDSSFIG